MGLIWSGTAVPASVAKCGEVRVEGQDTNTEYALVVYNGQNDWCVVESSGKQDLLEWLHDAIKLVESL